MSHPPKPRREARINIQTEIVNGERFFFLNRFPRGHYLVWWVRVSLGVTVRDPGLVLKSGLGLELVTY